MNTDIGLGDLLRRARTERGEPLRVVAAAAGIDSTLLSRIERGERLPTAPQLVALAGHFGLPADELEALRGAARLMRQSWSPDAVWRAADVIEARSSSSRQHAIRSARVPAVPAPSVALPAVESQPTEALYSMSAPMTGRADRLEEIEEAATAGSEALDALEAAASDPDSVIALRATELLRQLRSQLR
jgi:transcriptional regulator with XRE-family HTH domain